MFCSYTQKGFRGKTPTLRGPERLGQPPPRNAKSARLAAFDKIGNGFSFTYSQMTAQQFRQLGVYCRHLYFVKVGLEINCCVFKSRECMTFQKSFLSPLKLTLFQRKMHCCQRRRHDVTCSRRNCYVTCGHNIIYDMTLSTE